MPDQPAFLSIRVPPPVRNRVKALAARRGESVQDLMGRWVERLLAEEDPTAPDLPTILRTLRARRADLESVGVQSLWVFGSVARGEALPGSDVDLVATFRPDAKVSLTAVARLREELSAWLGRPVDLSEWRLMAGPVLDEARRDAVQVF